VVKGQAANEVLCQTGRALYTSVTNELTTWPLSGQQGSGKVTLETLEDMLFDEDNDSAKIWE
jgi:hypothetical protein